MRLLGETDVLVDDKPPRPRSVAYYRRRKVSPYRAFQEYNWFGGNDGSYDSESERFHRADSWTWKKTLLESGKPPYDIFRPQQYPLRVELVVHASEIYNKHQNNPYKKRRLIHYLVSANVTIGYNVKYEIAKYVKCQSLYDVLIYANWLARYNVTGISWWPLHLAYRRERSTSVWKLDGDQWVPFATIFPIGEDGHRTLPTGVYATWRYEDHPRYMTMSWRRVEISAWCYSSGGDFKVPITPEMEPWTAPKDRCAACGRSSHYY